MVVKTGVLLLALVMNITVYAQQWTDAQLDEADTAADIPWLTEEEQDAIMYINLCRLYPGQFAEQELARYQVNEGFPDSYKKQFHKYRRTLLKDLLQRQAAQALQFDSLLTADARCYSTEISRHDRKGHARIDCKESGYAECISFGMESGRDIAIQWLVDAGVSSLGHRKISLNPSYRRAGISINTHFKWRFCAVAEFQ